MKFESLPTKTMDDYTTFVSTFMKQDIRPGFKQIAEMESIVAAGAKYGDSAIEGQALARIGLDSADELTLLKQVMATPPAEGVKYTAEQTALIKKFTTATGAEEAFDASKFADEITETGVETLEEGAGNVSKTDGTAPTEGGGARNIEDVEVDDALEVAQENVGELIENSAVNKIEGGSENLKKLVDADGNNLSKVSQEAQEVAGDFKEVTNALKDPNLNQEQATQLLEDLVAKINKIEKSNKKIIAGLEGSMEAMGKSQVDFQRQLMQTRETLITALGDATKTMGDVQATSIKQLETALNATLDNQTTLVQAAVKTEMDSLAEALKAGKLTPDEVATQIQELTSKIDDLGKAATKEEIIELINKATTGKIDDAADAANKTSGGWLDAGREYFGMAAGFLPPSLGKTTVLSVLFKGAQIAVIGYVGYKAYQYFTSGSNAPPTNPPTMMTQQNRQAISNKMTQLMLDQYLNAVEDCLQNKEVYKAGTQSQMQAQAILARVRTARSALAGYQSNPTALALQVYTNEADALMRSMSAFGLKAADRQADIDTTVPNISIDLRNCIQSQGQTVSKLQDISNDINSLQNSQQALQLSQQQGQQGGSQQMQQGTVLNPQQGQPGMPPAPKPQQRNIAVYRQNVTIVVDGYPVTFNLNTLNMIPTRNLSNARNDYKNLVNKGKFHRRLSKAINKKSGGTLFNAAEPDRFQVLDYAYDSASMPQGVGNLSDLVSLAAGGDSNAQTALTEALARHVKVTLERGGSKLYGLNAGLFGGAYKRRW